MDVFVFARCPFWYQSDGLEGTADGSCAMLAWLNQRLDHAFKIMLGSICLSDISQRENNLGIGKRWYFGLGVSCNGLGLGYLLRLWLGLGFRIILGYRVCGLRLTYGQCLMSEFQYFGLTVQGLGFSVSFRVQVFIRFYCSGFSVSGFKFMVQYLMIRIWYFGLF